jgi:hypothetical protein
MQTFGMTIAGAILNSGIAIFLIFQLLFKLALFIP